MSVALDKAPVCLLGAPLGFSTGQVTLGGTASAVRGLEGRPWGGKGQGEAIALGGGRRLYDTASFLHGGGGGWQAGCSGLPRAEVERALRLSLPR